MRILSSNAVLAAGGERTLPAQTGGVSNVGIVPDDGVSPFGVNGRFAYTKRSGGR